MKHTIILLVIFLVTGCATAIPEAEIAGYREFCEREPEATDNVESCVKERIKVEREYIREVKDIEYLEEYYRQVILCKNSGGQMMITRRMGISRFGQHKPPERDDTYGCMSQHDFDRFMRGS
jgi:hypothetical protein